MRCQDRAGRQELQGEVAVRHGIDGVLGWPVKAQGPGRGLAVDGKRRAGQGRGPERRTVNPLPRVQQPAAVALEHRHIGHQVMAEGDGLRRLQMGKARHHRRRIFFSPVQKGAEQIGEISLELVESIPHPKPKVGGHLVVPRAGGMKAPGGLADDFLEARLHIHVDVLQGRLERELSFLDLPLDLVQAAGDGGAVGFADDALAHQHARMGLGAGDVLGKQALVKTDGGVDTLHDGGRTIGEAPAPHAIGGRGGLCFRIGRRHRSVLGEVKVSEWLNVGHWCWGRLPSAPSRLSQRGISLAAPQAPAQEIAQARRSRGPWRNLPSKRRRDQRRWASSRTPTAIASPCWISATRWCCWISGRPGAWPVSRRCRRWTGCKANWATKGWWSRRCRWTCRGRRRSGRSTRSWGSRTWPSIWTPRANTRSSWAPTRFRRHCCSAGGGCLSAS